jgi:hypothetical protein
VGVAGVDEAVGQDSGCIGLDGPRAGGFKVTVNNGLGG